MKPPYTPRQGQFLAFIHHYTTLHGRPPAEAEMMDFFRISPPSVHQMVLTLERRGFITRVPGKARSTALRLPPETLPPLQSASGASIIPSVAEPKPPKPEVTQGSSEAAVLLGLGKIQLEGLFAWKARHSFSDSQLVPLLEVLIESFACAGLEDPLVQSLRKHVGEMYHRSCQERLPEITFAESMERLVSHLPDSSGIQWRKALSIPNAHPGPPTTAPSIWCGYGATPRPPLTAIQKRNQSILELSCQGVGHDEIARRFRLSRSNINGIIRRVEEERRLAEKGDALLALIRQANDLDAVWPTTKLIDALGPLPVIVTRLQKHFEGLKADTISLRFLMDMAIPEIMAQKLEGQPPLLKVEGVGKKGYWSVVNRLTNLDLGDQFTRQWRERLVILVRAWRISGPFPYST